MNLNVFILMKSAIKLLIWGVLSEYLTFIFYQQALTTRVKNILFY